MDRILEGHTVLADVKDDGHGSCPGQNYSHADCVISYRDDRYRCYVICETGSDQGYYQRNYSHEACGRGDSIGSAVDDCRDELRSDDQLTYAAKQALSEAYDDAERNEAEGLEITYGRGE